MILTGLFVKVIIFQILRKYRRPTAVSFDIYDVWKHLKKPLLKTNKIKRIQEKSIILSGLFVKVTTFQLFRNNRRASVVNFDKYNVMKTFARTFIENTWNNTNSTVIHDFGRAVQWRLETSSRSFYNFIKMTI